MKFTLFNLENTPVDTLDIDVSIRSARSVATELMGSDPTVIRCTVVDEEDDTLIADLRKL